MPNDLNITETGVWVPLAGEPRYFNAWWLRSLCPSAIDPVTRERVFDLTTLQSAPRIGAATLTETALCIDWADTDHHSEIDLTTLTHWALHGQGHDAADLPRRLWYRGHDQAFHRVTQARLDQSEAALAALTRALIVDGVALITEMEASEDGLARLVDHIGPVTPSAEGASFEVRLEIAPTNLAFTAKALEMHTDLPGEEAAPGVQFLHCLANSVEGGYSLFADGAAVAEALRAEDQAAFDLLSSHDIPFFYRHDGWDYRAHQRVIELDHQGRVTGVTCSQHLMDNLDLPQPLLDRYYPALHRFLQLANDPRFLCRFRLNAGECIVFDNHRILHGREAYSADHGQRHLRGCYTDRGALRSTYRVLAARGFDGVMPEVTAAE